MYLAEIFKKPRGHTITDLDLSKTAMQSKTGVFIGQALMEAADSGHFYPIERLWLKDIH